eukprot:Gb_06958 [translate_table: standard]
MKNRGNVAMQEEKPKKDMKRKCEEDLDEHKEGGGMSHRYGSPSMLGSDLSSTYRCSTKSLPHSNMVDKGIATISKDKKRDKEGKKKEKHKKKHEREERNEETKHKDEKAMQEEKPKKDMKRKCEEDLDEHKEGGGMSHRTCVNRPDGGSDLDSEHARVPTDAHKEIGQPCQGDCMCVPNIATVND